MTQNPFETPNAEPHWAQGQAATGQIDIGQCLSDAWKACWENFPLWLGVAIVATIILTIAQLTFIGIFIIWPVIYFGWTKFLLNMLDPNRADFNDLFAGFNTFGQALLPALGLGLLICVPAIPFVTITVLAIENEPVVISMMAVLVLVYGYATPRLGFAMFYIVDRGMGAMEALRASWEATRGQWLTIFGLWLLTIVVTFVGYLALLIGVIPASQITYLMFASAFRQMAGPAPGRSY